MFNLIIAQAFNGLVLGMIYVLLAMSLMIVWGMMEIINFSHGLFFALGAYFAYSLVMVTGNSWLCLVIVPLAVGLLGMLIEYTLLRRLYSLSILYQVLMTFGIAIVGQEIIILFYSPIGKSFYPPEVLSGAILIGGTIIAGAFAFAGETDRTEGSMAVYSIIRFDQAAFDQAYGADSFPLADYYQLVFSPNLPVSNPVPEPSTLLLISSGLTGMAGYGRKRFFKK